MSFPCDIFILLDASHVHCVPLVGVVPSFAPAASPSARRSSADGLGGPFTESTEFERHRIRRPTHCSGPDQPGVEPLTNRGGSATGSLTLHRPTFLARLRRLAVPTSRYVVRAAPAHHGTPMVDCPQLLPTAAAARGGLLDPRGITAPRGARANSSTP